MQLEDCCFLCAGCQRPSCGDDPTEADCGHADEPIGSGCCCERLHADEIARENYRAQLAYGLARWGQDAAQCFCELGYECLECARRRIVRRGGAA